MSSRPPWLDSTTFGAPPTGVFLPVVTSISQMRPGFSGTSATLVSGTPDPGRKSVAQGESKVATGVTLNGGADPAAETPHAARTIRRLIARARIRISQPTPWGVRGSRVAAK